jgi:hypothetical protein
MAGYPEVTAQKPDRKGVSFKPIPLKLALMGLGPCGTAEAAVST